MAEQDAIHGDRGAPGGPILAVWQIQAQDRAFTETLDTRLLDFCRDRTDLPMLTTGRCAAITSGSASDCARRSPADASTDRSACDSWPRPAGRPAPATAPSQSRRGCR